MGRRRQRSTLFPYTTLFRSLRDGHPLDQFHDKERPAAVSRAGIQDRKSTRLNSSHVAISYAVFCLKKKFSQNIHNPITTPTHTPLVTHLYFATHPMLYARPD